MALVCEIKSDQNEQEVSQQDLEDGEIEDDEELPAELQQETPNQAAEPEPPQPAEPKEEMPPKPDIDSRPPVFDNKKRDKRRSDDKPKKDEKGGKRHMTEAEKSILHLRKREKMMREQREKWEKTHKKKDYFDDDFAKNIEKTLATILNKKEKEAASATSSGGEGFEKEEERKPHKRKKHSREFRKMKQRRMMEDQIFEYDENEMLNVRGGSPDQYHMMQEMEGHEQYPSPRSGESYESDHSNYSEQGKMIKRKEQKRENRKNKKKERKMKEQEKAMQDSQEICVFYLQGKCQKTDCQFSHEVTPPMKLELCKFYLMDCCAKGDKCSYMHSEFPCKFYHMGLQCNAGENCKFDHGKPLSEGLKQILFKHIETAPRDMLGGFPRMTRDEALGLLNVTQQRLRQQQQSQQATGQQQQNIEGTADGVTEPGVVKDGSAATVKGQIPCLFDINVPVPLELARRPAVVPSDDSTQSTKSEKTRNRPSRWQDPDPVSQFPLKPFNYGKDLDMRISSTGDIDMRTLPPTLAPANPIMNPINFSDKSQDSIKSDCKKDVDIRSTANLPGFLDSKSKLPPFSQDVDIRQGFMDVDIRQLPNYDEDFTEDIKLEPEPQEVPKKPQEVFSQVQAQTAENSVESDPDKFDVDISNINWYSDDDDDEDRLMIKVEEDEKKEKEEDEEAEVSQEEQKASEQPIAPPAIEPLDVVAKLGDLSKIDISAEVTRLLTSMSQNKGILPSITDTTASEPVVAASSSSTLSDPRTSRQDPRLAVTSGLQSSPRSDPRLSDPRNRSRQSSTETQEKEKKPEKISIYEQGGMDLKEEPEEVFRGLRPDIDLRNLTLPFKGMENYTPATEIDASINSHPVVPWKITTVDIPRPDYTGLKLSINDAEKTGDPRLRKIFRLSTEEKDSPMSPKESPKVSSAPRVDPRRRKIEEPKFTPVSESQMSYSQQLSMLQSSAFYQSLTSNQKLMLNQELASRSDQSGTHNPVLDSLLTNLNLIPGTNIQNNPNLSAALAILANVSKINPILPQNQPPMMGPMGQPGLLGAAPGIPNIPSDFPINFDPRNGGLLGNAPAQFGGNFPPEGNFNQYGDEFYQNDGGFHGNRDNRGFNRDRRRGRSNFNRNPGNRNFRNNRNNHRQNRNENRNHSPP